MMMTIETGAMVMTTMPTLHGPKEQAGTVARVLEDGRVEIRMQLGGYVTKAAADVRVVRGRV